jgi:hypothetical protein
MEDRQGRINELLDDLEPEQRDYLKQAVREIVAQRVARPRDAVEARDHAAA